MMFGALDKSGVSLHRQTGCEAGAVRGRRRMHLSIVRGVVFASPSFGSSRVNFHAVDFHSVRI
jgi:hypothetical protein